MNKCPNCGKSRFRAAGVIGPGVAPQTDQLLRQIKTRLTIIIALMVYMALGLAVLVQNTGT